MAYAENTSVPVDRSKAEIERILQRYGADQFISGWDKNRAMIGFRMNGRQIRFIVELPNKSSKEFTHTPGRKNMRDESKAYAAWEQACRQRWRALALVIKAKLESVETGVTVFEDEFMAHIVLPDGQTVGEYMRPQIDIAYQKGNMPKLLPYGQ